MLSDLQRRKLTRYFRVYDVNDDGRIGPADFERVVENVRILHGLHEDSAGHVALRDGYLLRWEALRESADADDDGGVDLEEWLAYWGHLIEVEDRYEAEVTTLASRLFEIFDTDEDGLLGQPEFRDFYGVYGLHTRMADGVFDELDEDDDGMISHERLVELGHQFYRGDDPEAPGNRLFGPF